MAESQFGEQLLQLQHTGSTEQYNFVRPLLSLPLELTRQNGCQLDSTPPFTKQSNFYARPAIVWQRIFLTRSLNSSSYPISWVEPLWHSSDASKSASGLAMITPCWCLYETLRPLPNRFGVLLLDGIIARDGIVLILYPAVRPAHEVCLLDHLCHRNNIHGKATPIIFRRLQKTIGTHEI